MSDLPSFVFNISDAPWQFFSIGSIGHIYLNETWHKAKNSEMYFVYMLFFKWKLDAHWCTRVAHNYDRETRKLSWLVWLETLVDCVIPAGVLTVTWSGSETRLLIVSFLKAF